MGRLAQLYPNRLTGFVSIDSAPLQRNYVTAVELWLLKRMKPVYAHYPWKLLLKSGTEGVATSDYGRNLMREMMLVVHYIPKHITIAFHEVLEHFQVRFRL